MTLMDIMFYWYYKSEIRDNYMMQSTMYVQAAANKQQTTSFKNHAPSIGTERMDHRAYVTVIRRLSHIYNVQNILPIHGDSQNFVLNFALCGVQ